MTKLDTAIVKEIKHMAIALCGAFAIICLVFFLIGKFNGGVALGCALGCAVTMIGFVWLGFSVQKAVNKGDAGRLGLQASYYGRMLMYGTWVVVAAKWSYINVIASVIPIFLPNPILKLIQFLGLSKDEASKNNNIKE